MSKSEQTPEGKRLEQAIREAGLTPAQFARKMGVQNQNVKHWQNRGISKRRADEAALILGVTKGWLLTGEGQKTLTAYKIDKKQFTDRVEESPIDSNIAEAPRRNGDIPLISDVRAGHLSEIIDNFQPGDADAWLPCYKPHGAHSFALRIQGDSMVSPYLGEMSFFPGSIIFVDPDRPCLNGSKVVAKRIDTNEATFKVYVEDSGRRYLRPLNPQYPMVEMDHNFEIVGVVFSLISDV